MVFFFIFVLLMLYLVLALSDAGFPAYLFGTIAVATLWYLQKVQSRFREMRAQLEGRLDELQHEMNARMDRLEATVSKPAPAAATQHAAAAPATEPPRKAAQEAARISTPANLTAMPAKAPPAAPPPVVWRTPPPPPRVPFESSTILREQVKKGIDLEVVLGTNWLSKLGILILVLGIAFFLAWQVRELGPAGKVMVGCLCGLALLGAGIYFERSNQYRILARAGVAGGWAMLFFTAYAMYHIQAAKVLSSPLQDLVVMLVIAAAMVWHTLRYRSEVVTSLAFLTAFSTVAFNRTDVYSLTASLVLAAALSAVVVRMKWYRLEIFGILATYLNHFLWIQPIISAMGKHHHPFPEFLPSAVILVLYWGVFRASYLLRKQPPENISTIAALLNTVLLLALLKYQSVHPEWAFWVLLALGTLELALGQLPISRARRTPFIVLTTIGAALLFAAFPFRYAPQYVSSIWVCEAEALFLIGIFTHEKVFRRLGMLAGLAITIQMLGVDAARVFGERFDGAYVVREFKLASIFLLTSALFYFNAVFAPRRWKQEFSDALDQLFLNRLSYLAAIIAFVSAWIAFPVNGTVVGWIAITLVLAWLGSRFAVPALRIQATVIAALALLRAFVVNFHTKTQLQVGHQKISARLLTTSLLALGFYFASRWSRISERKLVRHVPAAFIWAGSTLISFLLWYELRPLSVALAWTLLGIALLELGLSRSSLHLRLQAYVAFLASFTRLFFVNLNGANSALGQLSPRIYTVVPVAIAFFYAYERLTQFGAEDARLALDRRLHAAQFLSYFGTFSFVALMRFELPLDWIAAAWAALVPLLLAIAWRMHRRVFLDQALLISVAVLFRAIFHNFYMRSYFTASARMLQVGSAIALLFAALPFAFRLRVTRGEVEDEFWLKRLYHALSSRPEQMLFFIPLGLLTILLAIEMRHGTLTMAWVAEAVGVFFFALWAGERSYRLSAIGLLLLCVGKIIVIDIWRLNIRDRAFTFIVLGASLVLVSVLYTRHREALKQYL